jgi:hypothetical protein
MNTPPSQDPFEVGDYHLAMIAAPFAAAGKTTEEALHCAQALLLTAFSTRLMNEDAKRRDVTRDMSTWPIDALAKSMKLEKRSVWKNAVAVLGEKETARLREKERLNPGSKLFPPEVWKRIIAHQKTSIQNRNRKAAQNAHRRVLKSPA